LTKTPTLRFPTGKSFITLGTGGNVLTVDWIILKVVRVEE